MAFQDAPTALQVAQQIALQVAPLVAVSVFLLGQLFAIALEWLRGRATAARERDARAQLRKEAIEDRRADFQRQTLIGLQDTLQDFARTGGWIHARREQGHQDTGTWEAALGEELNREAREAFVRINVLQSRVLDKDLREMVEQVKQRQLALALATSKAASDKALDQLSDDFDRANNRLGELLRALY